MRSYLKNGFENTVHYNLRGFSVICVNAVCKWTDKGTTYILW